MGGTRRGVEEEGQRVISASEEQEEEVIICWSVLGEGTKLVVLSAGSSQWDPDIVRSGEPQVHRYTFFTERVVE